MRTKRLLAVAILGATGVVNAQEAARTPRTPVDTSRSSLPAYQRTPTVRSGAPGVKRRTPKGATTPAAPSPAASKTPGGTR